VNIAVIDNGGAAGGGGGAVLKALTFEGNF
jgi:hypothetical protein